jgi:nitronate monooxygenase
MTIAQAQEPPVQALLEMAQRSGIAPWRLGGRTLLPVVQGGMGVGVSAGGLAGSVAALGGVGTVSAVDLRRLHPDLFEATRRLTGESAKALIDAANLEALDRELRRARDRRRRGLDRGERDACPG